MIMMSDQRLPSTALHSTFESLDVLLVFRRFRLRLVVIYRPPLTGKRKAKTSGVTIDNFLAEIEPFVESLSMALSHAHLSLVGSVTIMLWSVV